MLVVRAEQMEALGAPREAAFRARVAAHVRKYFTDAWETLGDDDASEAIAAALAKARAYGFNSERELCRYVNLTFVFGRDFDRDPSLPWAAEILGATQLPSASRMDRLCLVAAAHAEQLGGSQ